MIKPASHDQRRPLSARLNKDGEDPKFASIVGAYLDEIVSSDVARVLRPEPDARPVVQPQSSSLGLFLPYLQVLTPPYPLAALVVHRPAGCMQQRGR